MGCGQSDPRPTWWLLYVIGLLLMGLVGLVEFVFPGRGERTVLDVAAVVAMFGLMAAWARHNRVAIELEQWQARKRPGGPSDVPPDGQDGG